MPHKRGVIHRDLKPSNILVSQDGQPHVLDFGLAKAFLKESSDVTVSIEGDVAGTPAYMSPEQAMGRKEQMDTRTDVYSLGIILYQFLTGESPHELSGTRFEIIRKIVEEDVHSPREINRDIDCDLEALLLKALARDPDDRYLSAGEMADDIDNYLNGKPLHGKVAYDDLFSAKENQQIPAAYFDCRCGSGCVFGISLFAYSIGVQSGAKVKVTQKELEIQKKAAELESQTPGKNDKETPVAIKPLKAENARPTPQMLYGRRFRFSWRAGKGSGINGIATLNSDGTIGGYRNDNETFWLIDEEGRLVFKHRDGRVSSIFTHVNQRDGKWFFSGPFPVQSGRRAFAGGSRFRND